MLDTAVDYIYGMAGDTTYFMDKDVVVMHGAEFNVSDIVLLDSGILENNGIVNTDIDVCVDCKLEIYNRGVFNVGFTLRDNASVVQVISSESDLNKIDFNVDYSVRVDGVYGTRLSDIIWIGSTANEILIHDSQVVWDTYDADSVSLKLSGDVNLVLDDVEAMVGKIFPGDVASDAYVHVTTNGVKNPMFVVNSYVENGHSYLRLVRETDYTRFMDNDVGAFINSLRSDSAANGFMVSMDNALSMGDINAIMADSVRIAPINMMDSVRLFNVINVNDFDYETGGGLHYVLMDESYSYGLFMNGSVDFGKLTVGGRGYINSLILTDSFDAYSGIMLGGNIYGKYEHDSGFVRGVFGGNITYFDISNVFNGKHGVDNPVGYSIYSAVDAGRNFDFKEKISVTPYVGLGTNYITILHSGDLDYVGRTGMDVSYVVEAFGIKYDYAIRMGLNTNSEINFGGRVGAVSDMDMIGGHIAIDYIDNKTGRGYKITAGVNVLF